MNKQKSTSVFILSLGLLLFSCSESETSNQNGNLNKKESEKIAACLKNYNYDYSKMLTLQDVIKHTNVNESSITVKYDHKEEGGFADYNQCEYLWPSGRKDKSLKIGNIVSKNIPDDNVISLSNVKFESGNPKDLIEYFDNAYKPFTDKDVELAEARIDESFKNKTEEERTQAKKFIKMRKNMKFKEVSDLGDRAYWQAVHRNDAYWGVELIVLVSNVKFSVISKISEDDQENLKMALNIAHEVINKCK